MEPNVNGSGASHDADQSLARALKSARAQRGWTLAQCAEASGVSRAMISKIERGEVSPTAAVIARLAGGLGVTMSALLDHGGPAPAPPFSPRAAQAAWRDPVTGYVRRVVSPRGRGAAMEIVEVELPPRQRVMFDNCAPLALAQFVWLLAGALEMTIDGETTRMAPGDCLHMRLDRPITFHNRAAAPARYAVVIETGAAGGYRP
jgi:transcriptional regulator with XRE-family HTH domain